MPPPRGGCKQVVDQTNSADWVQFLARGRRHSVMLKQVVVVSQQVFGNRLAMKKVKAHQAREEVEQQGAAALFDHDGNKAACSESGCEDAPRAGRRRSPHC